MKRTIPLDNDKSIQRSFYEDGFSVEDLCSCGTKTRVMIKDSKTGKVLFDGHNTTVLGGRLHLLEKSFGITPDITQHLTLNTIMGIEHSETNRVFQNKIDRDAIYFMAGKGASSVAVPGKIFSPKNYETKLYDAIPFRMVPVSNDLSASEQEQYRLRKIVSYGGVDYAAYYAKRFDAGVINLEYNDASYTPLESDTVPVDENDSSHRLAGGSVLAYIQFTLTITEEELKEYFRITNGSLSGAVMNEIGLVLGADLANSLDNNRKELSNAELFAKIVSSNVAMDSDSVSRIVEYRVYAR